MTDSLRDQLQHIIHHGRASATAIAAHRLATGEEILIDAEQPFHPASTMKLCVMCEVYHQAQQGRLALDEPITIHNQFASIVDGSPYSLTVEDDSETELYECIGQSFTCRELVHRMITVSSNLATNLLIDRLGAERVNRFMQELGAGELVVLRGVEDKQAFRRGLSNSATARGLVTLLLRLARREVVSPEASDEMLGVLLDQKFNEMIPAGLPAGVPVAHKTGSISDHFHDAGIVYPPGNSPYVLVILTKRNAENEDAEAHAYVASLARAVYERWG